MKRSFPLVLHISRPTTSLFVSRLTLTDRSTVRRTVIQYQRTVVDEARLLLGYCCVISSPPRLSMLLFLVLVILCLHVQSIQQSTSQQFSTNRRGEQPNGRRGARPLSKAPLKQGHIDRPEPWWAKQATFDTKSSHSVEAELSRRGLKNIPDGIPERLEIISKLDKIFTINENADSFRRAGIVKDTAKLPLCFPEVYEL